MAMVEGFEALREMTLVSVFVRMLFSFISGGLIGMEREFRRRAAGFRTHILICIGACVAAMTGQFLALYMGYPTDVTRLGAQVIPGIGFIGAGSIIRIQDNKIKGLTTAAGLWAAAIVGLCFGSGFFEAGILATLLILGAEILLVELEHHFRRHAPKVCIYVVYAGEDTAERMLFDLKEKDIRILNMQIGDRKKRSQTGAHMYEAVLTIRMDRYHLKKAQQELKEDLFKIQGVREIEIL